MTARQRQIVSEWWKDLIKPSTLVIVIGLLWVGSKKTYFTISYGVAMVDTIHQSASICRSLDYKIDTTQQWVNVKCQLLEKRVSRLEHQNDGYAGSDPFNLADLGGATSYQ